MCKKIKKWHLCFLVLLITIFTWGCERSDEKKSDIKKAQDKLLSLTSYACDVEITHISEKEKHTYKAKQIYHIDGRYRMEILKPDTGKGVTTIFDGEKIWQYNPYVKLSKVIELTPNSFRNQIFLGTFIHNYLQSEQVALETRRLDQNDAVALEAVIPGGSTYMASQKLWIDEKSSTPIRMAIYDENNNERVTVEFLEFTYNPEVKEGVFSLK